MFNKFLLLFVLFPVIGLSQEKLTEKQTLSFEENFFDALSYRIKSDYDKSNDFFHKCLEIDPKNDVILFKIAQNYYDKKDFEQAETYIREALKYNNENKWYHFTLIKTMIDKGEEYKEVQKMISNFSKISNNKYLDAFLYKKLYQKNYKPKVKYQVAKTNKQNNSFDNLLQEKKYKLLIDKAEKQLEENPDDPTIYLNIAKAYYFQKKYHKTIEYLDLGIDFAQSNNSEKEFYQLYYQTYKAMGKDKKAKKYQQKLQRN